MVWGFQHFSFWFIKFYLTHKFFIVCKLFENPQELVFTAIPSYCIHNYLIKRYDYNLHLECYQEQNIKAKMFLDDCGEVTEVRKTIVLIGAC